jgi:hypothetical protein
LLEFQADLCVTGVPVERHASFAKRRDSTTSPRDPPEAA